MEQAIQCSSCARESEPGARYCESCGGALGKRCGSCEQALPPEAFFCPACGARTGPPAAGTDASSPPRGGPEAGERRQLTVLFCDLVGSTEISTRLDPEEWYTLAARYQRSVADTVAQYGGHVAKYLGDGLLVYFGWPQAHEDDAERGVRAGLAILGAIRRLGEGSTVSLAVRVAVHTGSVVVGPGGGGDPEIFGEVPNVAARLQALAEPGTLLVTAATQRLVAGLFIVEDRGPCTLKGLLRPVQLYRVRRVSGVPGRLFAAAGSRGLAPFVGRERERLLLRRCWERAHAGEGQVVLVTGEPGIGKSRLVWQFREDLGAAAYTWSYCACLPFFQHTPFHPVADMLQRALAWGTEDLPLEQRLAGLEAVLRRTGLDPGEAMPLLAPLLDLPLASERYGPAFTTPEQRWKKLLSTLVAWVLGSTQVQAMAIVFEDLQWADPSTLELQRMLVERCASARLLLILTARPEFSPPWGPCAHHTQVALGRLTHDAALSMIQGIVAGASLPGTVVETVIERSDGVPLFVEELARTMTAGAVDARDVPETLRDSLMARLDRLGEAKEIAQVGAVLGREFSYELLRCMVAGADEQLEQGLLRLQDAALVYRRGSPPDATYTFTHALVHDTAYASLLKSRRRELHRTAAITLRDRFGQLAAATPELLAWHWSAAGEAGPAAVAWRTAGRRALDRGAHAEAVQHFTQELTMIARLPQGTARDRQELKAQLRLGQAAIVAKGYGAPEPTAAFTRAQELGDALGGTQENATFVLGLSASALGRGELRAAGTLAERLVGMSARHEMGEMLAWAHAQVATVCVFRGDLAGACSAARRAVACYHADQHREAPQDPAVVAHSSASLATAALGQITEARAHSGAALDLAEKVGRPTDRAFAGAFASAMHVLLGEADAALDLAERVIALSEREQLQVFRAVGRLCRAGARAHRASAADVITTARESLETLATIGFRNGWTQYLAWLAGALRTANRIPEALVAVDDGLGGVPEEGFYRPELLRLRAGLLATSGSDRDVVDAGYQEAIALARVQGHVIFEARAAASFVGWLQRSGRSAAAVAFASSRAPMVAGLGRILAT